MQALQVVEIGSLFKIQVNLKINVRVGFVKFVSIKIDGSETTRLWIIMLNMLLDGIHVFEDVCECVSKLSPIKTTPSDANLINKSSRYGHCYEIDHVNLKINVGFVLV